MGVRRGGRGVGMTDNVMEGQLSGGGEMVGGGVKMRPGKPVSLFVKDNKLAFCLPGNPGATALCAQVLLVPYLRGSMGQSIFPQSLTGKADFAFTALADTTHFLPVSCAYTAQGPVFSLLPTVGASDIRVLSRAVGFLQVNPSEGFVAGQMCQVLPF